MCTCHGYYLGCFDEKVVGAVVTGSKQLKSTELLELFEYSANMTVTTLQDTWVDDREWTTCTVLQGCQYVKVGVSVCESGCVSE